MGEIYSGVRFNAIRKNNYRRMSKKDAILLLWCKKFDYLGFSPDYGKGSSGNLSYRSKKGFVITPTASHSSTLSINDFCEIISVDIEKNHVLFNGKKIPSSESLMHYLIYLNNPNVNAVFHGHSNLFLQNTFLFSCTKEEFHYGTPELAKIAAIEASKSDFFILKNHGFVSVGKSMKDAGVLAINKYLLLRRKK